MPGDAILLSHLDALFFAGNPVSARMTLEGSRIDAGGIVLGMRAGPVSEIANLVHEMCHLVEIDDSRMTVRNWGLHSTGYLAAIAAGRPWFGPTTDQALRREMRVWAYQWNVTAALSLPGEKGIAELVRPAVFVDGFMNFPGETEKDRLAAIAQEVEAMLPEYSFDRFCEEWARRMPVIRQHLQQTDKPSPAGAETEACLCEA